MNAQHARRSEAVGGRAVALILGAALLFAAALLNAANAPGPSSAPGPAPTQQVTPASQMLDEIDVVGERPGPRLWKITQGDHILWLLGTLTHIPRRMTWRSSEVEAALAQSQELLDSGLAVSASVGPIAAVKLYFQWRHTEKNPEHTTLKTWVPPTLYARFEAIKGNFDSGDSSIEELRPSLAALRLYDRAVDAAGLTERDTIEQAVVKLAKKQHVPVQRPKVQVNDPSGALKEVSSLPPSLEIDCLEATVVRIETDLQNMQQRALAWSVGDLDKLRALPFSNQRDVCITVISNSARMKALVDSAEQAWLDEAKAALNRNRVSFAMRPIYELLDLSGPIAKLLADGYRIEVPDRKH